MAWLTLRKGVFKAPRLLLKGDFSYALDRMPMRATHIPWRKRISMLRSGTEWLAKRSRLKALPAGLQIEPINVCNLKCPLCPTGAGALGREQGAMSLDLFRRILDETDESLVAVVLYGWGEPFLNKDIMRMISECSTRNILTATSTNGHCIQTLERAQEVVDAGLKALVFAMDGSTQEIYETYRRGGDLEKVKNCVNLIEEAKRRRKSAFPYTNIRAVATRENERDLPNIKKFAQEAGVNMFSYKSVGCFTTSPEFSHYETPGQEMRRFTGKGRKKVQCPYAFRQPTIYWDGVVAGCEFDFGPQIPFGNVAKQSFREIWNSDAAVGLREGLLGRRPKAAFCKDCPYRDEGQAKTVLWSEELKPLK